MLNVIVVCAVLAGFSLMVSSLGMVGEGLWILHNIGKCENDESYSKIKIDVAKIKKTRTVDVFDAILELQQDLDDSYAIRIDCCKFVDGGCKPYQTLHDESCARFCEKYAKNNTETALTMAGLEKPGFPIPAGKHSITGYFFNTCELPPNCPYGDYECKAHVIKDGLELSCVKVRVECVKEEEKSCPE